MNNVKINVSFLILWICQSVQASTMNNDSISVMSHLLDYYSKVPQERIYLHTDRPYYMVGDTIWFRAHLLDAATRIPVSRSRYIYVELYEQNADTLVQRMKVRCDSSGVFANAMFLSKTMTSGSYTMVAYTQWMRNFGSDHFCYKPIYVTAKTGDDRYVSCVEAPIALQSSPLLEVKQRKGQLLIRMSDASESDTLTCVIYGGGNLVETPYVGSRVLRIGMGRLHPGVVTVAMIRPQDKLVLASCETQIASHDSICVSMKSQMTEGKKMPIASTLTLTDQKGRPLKGTFSVSVTDYDVVKPDTLQPTLSQWAVSHRDGVYPLADMLRGRYPQMIYPIETEQRITGRVKSTSKSKLKNPHLLLVNPVEGVRHEFELGDSSRFSLTVDSPEGTTWLLEGTKKSGSTEMVELQVDKQIPPMVRLPHYVCQTGNDLSVYVKQSNQQQMYAWNGVVELPEFEKKGSKKKPESMNYGQLEAPRNLYPNDPRIEHAASMETLLSQLGIYCYVGEDGQKRIGGVGQIVGKKYVDNVAETDDEEILAILPQNVRSIEYFTMNHPQNTMYGVRADIRGRIPGVLFIFLKDGSEIEKRKHLLSMARISPLGYRYNMEFYSPQYPKTDKSDYTRPDYRTTLYWNPSLQTDDAGEAMMRFYSSDSSKRYLITIEGATEDGQPVSWQGLLR